MSGSSPRIVSHQVVRLSRGAHGSPDEGACVIELASMLAGEPFSDHPRAVCEVIAAFLRRYNDAVDDGRRRDLYPAAAVVVGTRAPELEGRRARACAAALVDVASQMSVWRRSRAGARNADRVVRRMSDRDVAHLTGRVLASAGARGHVRALALVDELVAAGAEEQAGASRPASRLAATAS